MGFVLLVGLGALALVGGSALAHRGWGGAGGSCVEEAFVAILLGLALILVPIHVLGWTGLLSPASIAAGVALSSAAAFALGVAGDPGARARAALDATVRHLTLPLRALREAWQERSAALFLLLILYGVWLYTAWLAWLAPSSSWDGLMYHEAMVAFALREGSYRWVELPPDIQLVNGFPRGAEALQLFLVAFTDRRLIDAAQHLGAVPAVLAVYLLCRRFAPRSVSAGLAAATMLVPGFVLQLRSTYVDVTVTAMLLAGIHFCTRPGIRLRDLWMLALTAGLYGGMKANAPVVVPVLLLVGLARSLPLLRRGIAGRLLLTHLLGLALLLGLAAPTYVRNYLETGNPAWPVKVTVGLLDLELEGTWDVQDQQRSFDSTLEDLYAPPRPGQDFVDTRHRGYGHALPWVILPLALLALLGAGWGALSSAALRRPPRRGVWQVLLLALVVLACQVSSPAFWWARFNLHGVALAFVLTAWLLAPDRRRLFAEAVLGACAALAAMTLYWADPAWDVSLEEARELAVLSPRERATKRIGWAVMMEEAGEAREREIGAGDVVAWNGGFIGVLWNEALSNDVVWVDWGPDYLARLADARAEWAVVRPGTPSARTLEASELWEKVGEVGPRVVAYRRTSL